MALLSHLKHDKAFQFRIAKYIINHFRFMVRFRFVFLSTNILRNYALGKLQYRCAVIAVTDVVGCALCRIAVHASNRLTPYLTVDVMLQIRNHAYFLQLYKVY